MNFGFWGPIDERGFDVLKERMGSEIVERLASELKEPLGIDGGIGVGGLVLKVFPDPQGVVSQKSLAW